MGNADEPPRIDGNRSTTVTDGAGGNGTGPFEGSAPTPEDREEDEPPIPLAETFAEYDPDLDFTPESLRMLDDLTEDIEPNKRQDYAPHIAAYLGEVFVRSHDAEWVYYDAMGWVVAVPDPEGEEELVLTLPKVLEDCLEGEDTFAAVHDGLHAELGLEGPQLG